MQRAEPHADIDALFNQIDVTIGERDAKLDVRIFRLKRTQEGHDFETAKRYRHIDTQVAGRLELSILQHQLRLLELAQSLTAALEIRRSRLGQAHPARRPGN